MIPLLIAAGFFTTEAAPFCYWLVHFWESVVNRHGFQLKDLQSAQARGFALANCWTTYVCWMRKAISSVARTAYLHVARKIWWAFPFYAVF